jgi:hypothetical protein
MRALVQRTNVRLVAVLLALAPLLALAHVHAGEVGAPTSCATCTVAHHAAADVVVPPAVVPAARHLSAAVAATPAPRAVASRHGAAPRAPPVRHSTTL